jgi:NADPH2:quinone reductase
MRAAYIEETGPPEVIKVGELPRPEPGPRQALVRVHTAALNPIDLYLRSGMVPMPLAFPYVICCDLAGTVERVGQGCTRFKAGDRVWGSNQGLLGRQGTAAEYAAVDEAWLYPTPALLPDNDAAAMALVGITAHLGLFRFGSLKEGEAVYVPGGSGGVGSMVVQMAKAKGARVATAAGSPERIELCRRLGADLALNYKTDDIPAQLREFSPEGIDVWFETQREPNLEIAIPLLRKHGRMILIAGRAARPALPLGAFYPRNCALFGFAMFNATPDEQRHCAAEMNRLIEKGLLKPLVGRAFPLSAAADAHRFLEANAVHGAGSLTGKVIIAIE